MFKHWNVHNPTMLVNNMLPEWFVLPLLSYVLDIVSPLLEKVLASLSSVVAF